MRVVFQRGVVIGEYRMTPKVPFDEIVIVDAGNVDPHIFCPAAGRDECALYVIADPYVSGLRANGLWRVRRAQFPRIAHFPNSNPRDDCAYLAVVAVQRIVRYRT